MVNYWTREVSGTDLWVVHGGDRNEFEKIDLPNKSFAEGARLRTRDHQREKQSYSSIFAMVPRRSSIAAIVISGLWSMIIFR